MDDYYHTTKIIELETSKRNIVSSFLQRKINMFVLFIKKKNIKLLFLMNIFQLI